MEPLSDGLMKGSVLSMALEVKHVTKNFGGVTALGDLSLILEQGELLGLIGPNGSGKSTVLNIITGLYRPSNGDVFFEGNDISRLGVHKIARLGISRTFQTTRLFFNLKVWENIRTVYETRGSKTEPDEKIRESLSLVGLESKSNWFAHELSSAEQRLLMISMGVCTSPKVLLLDEPSAGMNAEEVSETMKIIKRIANDGCAVMLIEHNMRVIAGICERCLVLNYGKLIAEGRVDEIKSDPLVIKAYLGEE